MNQPPVLRRERSLSQVISDSFSITTGNFKSLGVMAAPAIVIDFLVALIQLTAGSPGMQQAVMLLSLPVQLVAYQLVSGAIALAVAGIETGRLLSPNDALDAASDRFGHLARASLRSTAICMLFAVTFIGLPLALYRLIRWLFIPQAVMLDSQSSNDALDYSAALVHGQWWSTLARLICAFGVLLVALIPLSIAITAVFPAIGTIVFTAVVSTFTIPYGVVVTTLIYFDLKQRKASYDSSTA